MPQIKEGTMKQKIIVISNKYDIHTDSVIECLSDNSEEVIRINTEDFRRNDLFFSNETWQVTTREGRIVKPKNVKSVYVRRISPILTDDTTDEYREFVAKETLVALDYLLFFLSKQKCMDSPMKRRVASNKIIQLEQAKKIGFQIPRYRITNNPDEAEKFVKSTNKIVYKTLSDPIIDFGENGEGMINASLVSNEDFSEQKFNVFMAPCQFQKYIEKSYELRIHVIEEKIIAVKIDSQAQEHTKIDWRTGQDLSMFETIEISKEIQEKVIKFIKSFGLHFGIIDMIVDKKGNYIFLELNPNGNWLFIESKIDIQISSMVAGWLSK